MISTELVERALRLINPAPTPEQAVALRTMLRTQVDNALRRLAVLALPNNLLRATFTVTATDGEASLATPLSASEPLLLEGFKRASVFIDGYTHTAQWKADRSSLAFPSSDQFAYYTLEDQTLVIRDSGGLDSYTGTVTLRNAPYIPILANVPVSLEPVLVEILATYGSQSTQVAQPDRRRDRRRGEDSGTETRRTYTSAPDRS